MPRRRRLPSSMITGIPPRKGRKPSRKPKKVPIGVLAPPKSIRKPRGPMPRKKKLANRATKYNISGKEKKALRRMKGDLYDLSKKRRYLPDMRKYYREAVKKARVRVAKKPG